VKLLMNLNQTGKKFALKVKAIENNIWKTSRYQNMLTQKQIYDNVPEGTRSQSKCYFQLRKICQEIEDKKKKQSNFSLDLAALKAQIPPTKKI
jgi:pyruvate/2-oxoacid:ferredoxin oxidoreductase beta subunit